MTSRDLFCLVLRIGALWILVWGCWQLSAAVVYVPATINSIVTNTPIAYGTITYATYGAPAVIGSVLILRFAEAIVNFTYRR